MKCLLRNACTRRNRCCRHCPEKSKCWQACKDNYEKCKYLVEEKDEELAEVTEGTVSKEKHDE